MVLSRLKKISCVVASCRTPPTFQRYNFAFSFSLINLDIAPPLAHQLTSPFKLVSTAIRSFHLILYGVCKSQFNRFGLEAMGFFCGPIPEAATETVRRVLPGAHLFHQHQHRASRSRLISRSRFCLALMFMFSLPSPLAVSLLQFAFLALFPRIASLSPSLPWLSCLAPSGSHHRTAC